MEGWANWKPRMRKEFEKRNKTKRWINQVLSLPRYQKTGDKRCSFQKELEQSLKFKSTERHKKNITTFPTLPFYGKDSLKFGFISKVNAIFIYPLKPKLT
jgi:hypothetical protein